MSLALSSSEIELLTREPQQEKFPNCGPDPLGFYPIVDRFAWLQRLLPLGVKTAQLRIKDLQGRDLEKEIMQSIFFARQRNCRLFINDHWQLAIRHGAYGVHLGQEDLQTADLAELLKQKIRLGISTHCFSEVLKARSFGPSYLAIGPIFPTTLKTMSFAPQGIAAFQAWRDILGEPLVAIGGMTLENSSPLKRLGAGGIAVVSDISKNSDPERRTRDWLRWLAS